MSTCCRQGRTAMKVTSRMRRCINGVRNGIGVGSKDLSGHSTQYVLSRQQSQRNRDETKE